MKFYIFTCKHKLAQRISYWSEKYNNYNVLKYSLTIWSAARFRGSFSFFSRRHDFRYVLIRFLALSLNSGNCLLHDWIMAKIFSLGCLEIGTSLSRFSSTNNLTNIWKTRQIGIRTFFQRNVELNFWWINKYFVHVMNLVGARGAFHILGARGI